MPQLASAFSGVLLYPTSSVGNRPAENALPCFSATAVVPGSWAYEQRGQPNEEADCDSSGQCLNVNEIQTTKKACGGDVVVAAKDM